MKACAFLFKLGEKIRIFKGLPIVARTHNVPAQVTTLGKRFATWAEELMFATKHVQELRNRLPLRGIKGAVGTQQDLMSVLDSLSVNLDDQIAQLFEFKHIAASSSQIYPRSFDYEIITSLVQLSAAATNVATNVRLMSGFGLVNEGLTENQVGSSAMPHKNNARLSERVTGLGVVLKGYAMMLSDISGNQWNEGDVSCSVVRRVALPEAFFAIDAILDTSINIISNLVINERAIESELTENLPFLLSSKILMKAVQGGLGRETAHKLIRKHALEALDNFYQSGENNFLELITKDQHLGIPSEFLKALADTPLQHTGRSQSQCDLVLDQIARCCNDRSDIVSYSPEDPR
jgi:adenylosuccinate lyase